MMVLFSFFETFVSSWLSRWLPVFVVVVLLAPLAARAADEDLVEMLTLKPEQYADDESSSRTADELEKAYPAESRPEAVKMLVAILRGSTMGPQDGWFGPAQSRFGWKWLAERHELPADAESITKDAFRGSSEQFQRLDRDGDGEITPSDLDWSDRNPWVQQYYLLGRIFRRINSRGDGRIMRSDLDAFFDRASQGKDHFNLADLRDALLKSAALPGDVPSRDTLVRGLIAGEVGSIHEGPQLDQPAPDFTLMTPDGKQAYQLSKLVGERPVVLVFGNFTCGPFRAFYPEVDQLFERYRKEATFLMVYVREAHPTDGWAMESNSRAGVAAAQPKTLLERTKICDQFCERLKPTMPVVVDDLNDAVGNAFSGMPARLYLIDRQGLVAHKSGRGPFGFKVGELEQALVMSLISEK